MAWPQYHRDDEKGIVERRQAISLHALIMLRWRQDYARQRPGLRRGLKAPEPGGQPQGEWWEAADG